jgi:hypothetical protein
MTPDALYKRKLLKYARHAKKYVIKFSFRSKDTDFTVHIASKQKKTWRVRDT